MFTKRSIVAIGLAALLAACGGGGGSSDVPAVDVPTVDVPAVVSPKINTGDSLTYAFTSKTLTTSAASGTTSESTSAYFQTRYYSKVLPDDSYSLVITYSNEFLIGQFEINSDFQETSYSNQTTICTNSPQIDGPGKTINVGTTWDLAYTRTCITSIASTSDTQTSTYKITNKGSVVGSESVITPAGTFDAYKLVYVFKSTGALVFGQSESVVNYTCWRDKVLNRTLGCDSTSSSSFTPTGQATSSVSTGINSYRLHSLNVASFSGSKPSAAQFAGNWALAWTGSNTGSCKVSVDGTGAVSGTCQPTGIDGPYAISGSVDVNGVLTAAITSGATISGNFASPIAASGSWGNAGAIGTWSAAHN